LSGRALVTGATGFLGQLACAALDRRGYAVTAVVRRPGLPPLCERAEVVADIADRAALRALLDNAQPDLILHLAGITRATTLDEVYRVNTVFGATLIDALAEAGATTPIVLTGSAAEYGPDAAADGPVPETAACRPTTPYGISKYAQTLHALAATTVHGVVARLFNPVGPGMRGHLALGSFAAQIAAMGPEGGVLKTGDLSAERDFIDADATADLLVRLGQTKAARGEVINLCSGIPTRVSTLVEAMIAADGRAITLDCARPSDSPSRGLSSFVGDPAKLQRFGLTPPALDVPDVVARILRATTT
jgi:GDP-4-dehydro-6-deoxy-D-mannose reductase